MTTDHIRATWAKAIVQREELARSFYARLFQIAPDTQPLFKNDMDEQGIKLVDTLNFIVDHLEEPDTLLPAARDLAVRHVSYGATAAHYDAVGAALLDALQTIIGPDFDDAAKTAWAETYSGLSSYMIGEASSA